MSYNYPKELVERLKSKYKLEFGARYHSFDDMEGTLSLDGEFTSEELRRLAEALDEFNSEKGSR